MKKEQILSTINEKLGQTTFSPKTISDYVDAFIPESEENPDFDKHVGFLKSLYGNYSADVAKQVNEAKEKLKPQNWEQQNQEPQPNKEVEDLKQQIADLAKKLDEKESKQTQEQFMSQVQAEMKKQGADDEYVLKQTLRGVTLDTKKSVGDTVKEMLAAYDSELTACRGKGAAPRNGEKNDSSKGKNSADAFFARKQKKEGWGNNSGK